MRIYPGTTVDYEFATLGDLGYTGTLNDRQFAALRAEGLTGSLPDMFGQFDGDLAGGDEPPIDYDAMMETLLSDGAHLALDTGRMADFWQDSAATSPVTADGQFVGWGVSRFGTTTYNWSNGNAGTLPAYSTDGYLLFARVSSQLLFGAANTFPILNAATEAFFSCSIWVNSIPGISVILGVGTNVTTTSRFTPQLNADGSVTLNVRRIDGDTNTAITSPIGTVAPGGYYTISAQVICSTGEMKLWVNGAEVASGTLVNPGAAFSATDSARVRVGAQVSSTGQYFDGYIRRPVLLRKSLSAADRAIVENWVAGSRSYSVGRIIASGVRTWFNSPSGAKIGTKIYVPQVNDDVAVTLTEWDYGNNSARVVHTTAATVSSGDDHNDGGVTVLADGNVLWMPVDHNGDDLRAVLGLPGSFTDNNLQAQIGSTGYSYTQIVQLDEVVNDPIYVFTRIGVANNWLTKSTDGGTTWSAITQQFSNLTSDRPYAQYCKINGSRIGLLISDAHPDEALFNTSIYYAYMEGDQWYKADGTSLGATPIEVTTLTKIYDGVANDPSWTWDIKPYGTEVVGLYASFPTYDAHRYHRTVIQDDGTFANEVIYDDAGYSLYGAAPNSQQAYSGGMALHPTNKDIVYACISKAGVQSGKHQLYRLDRISSGVWGETQLTDTNDEWFRPDTAGGHLTVCYGPYSSYTSNVGCRMLGIEL